VATKNLMCKPLSIYLTNEANTQPKNQNISYIVPKNIKTNHEVGKELVLLAKLAGAAPPSTLQLPTKHVMGLIRRVSEFSSILRYCV
jgi:hypothetical protein